MSFYPVFLHLQGRRGVVVGGGAVAEPKGGGLRGAGAGGGRRAAAAAGRGEKGGRLTGGGRGEFLALWGERGPAGGAGGPNNEGRPRLWYQIVDSDAVEYVRRRDLAGTRRRIEELVDEASPPFPLSTTWRGGQGERTGMVYLVGAGPGDPGLVTVRGLEALRTADVVVY